jgi:ParB-like chromosome segregation protein Spo0J
MLTFEQWPIDRLIEYARNPRKNDHAVDQMAAAIQEFGFRIPCVAQSDGRLVDGHLRLKAARKLGLDTVPVILADDLTPTQIKAFRLLANRSATWAEWDDDLLRLELDELKLDDFDLALTGFDADQLLEIMAGEEPTRRGTPTTTPCRTCRKHRCRDWVMCGCSASTGALRGRHARRPATRPCSAPITCRCSGKTRRTT